MKLSTFLLTALLISISVGALAEESTPTPENTESIFEQEFVLENIYCTGNTKTKCSLIKKELRVKSGKKVKDRDLQNSKIRLQLLGLFEGVELNLKKGSERGKVDLEVSVKEGGSIYTVFDLGLGKVNREDYSERSEFRNDLQFTLGTRNLFGLGKRLSATVYTQDVAGIVDGNGASSIGVRYTDPNILGHKRLFYNFEYVSVRRFYESSGFSIEDSPANRDFKSHGQLFQLEFGVRLWSFSYFTLGYAVANNEFRDNYNNFSGSFEERIEDSETANFVVFGFGVNTQNDIYFPTSGSRFELKLAARIDSRDQDLITYRGRRVSPGELEWRTTWQLQPKYYLTGFLEGRTHSDNEDLVNNGLGIEFAYQARQNQSYRDMSDLRFFVTPSMNAYSDFDDYGPQIAAGVKLRSKKYGLARFQVFLRDDR